MTLNVLLLKIIIYFQLLYLFDIETENVNSFSKPSNY